MKNLDDIKRHLETALTNNLEKGLDEIKKVLSEKSEHYNMFLMQNAKYVRNKSEEQKGVLTFDNAKMVYAQVTDALLSTIQHLQEKDLKSSNNFSILEKTITDLNIEEELYPIHLVNCNRNSSNKKFWKRFTSMDDKSPVQFHFISACKTQSPPSFSERLIYEIVDDFDEEIIHYPKKEDAIAGERVRVFPLPISKRFSLKEYKKKFKTFFVNEYKLKESEGIPFEQSLKTALAKKNEDYFVLPFVSIDIEWDDETDLSDNVTYEYLKWIFETFKDLGFDNPRFLFFFIVYIDDLHSANELKPHQKNIQTIINQLKEEYQLITSHISPLMPVEKSDVENWILKLGETTTAKIDAVIKNFINSISNPTKKEQYRNSGKYNMDDVEVLQKTIFKINDKYTDPK